MTPWTSTWVPTLPHRIASSADAVQIIPARPSSQTVYDDAGRTFQTIDALGNATEYQYDAAGRRVTTTRLDPDGTAGPIGSVTTQSVYNSLGQLTRSIAPNGALTEFQYDTLGRQTRVLSPYPETTGTTVDTTHATAYDEPLGLWNDHATTGRSHIATTGSPSASAVWSFTDLVPGQQVELLVSYPADSNNAPNAPFTVFDGTVIAGTPFGNAVTVNQRVAATHSILGDGWFSLGTYTPTGTTVEVRLTNVASAGHVVADAVRLLQARAVRETVYDAFGRFYQSIDPLGATTTYEYDDRGRQYKVTLPDLDGEGGNPAPFTETFYDAAGQVTQTIDALGRATLYTLDRLGRQTKATLPDPDYVDAQNPGPLDSPTHQTVFGIDGRVLESIGPLGNVTTFTYDDAGRQTRVTLPDPDGPGGDPSPEIEYLYNFDGTLLATINPLGAVTLQHHDKLGRTVKTILPDPDGDTATLSSPETETIFGLAGVLATIDPLDNVTTFQYDVLGRQVKVIDPLGGLTETQFDDLGNRTALIDPEQNTTSWYYDDLFRVIEEENELGDSRYFAYNVAGQQVAKTDRNGRVTRYVFDALGRRTDETWVDATGLTVHSIGFSFDDVGNMTAVTDTNANYSFTYDGLDRLVEKSVSTGGKTVVFSYEYDDASRVVEAATVIDSTDDFVNEYDYDNLGRVRSVRQFGVSGGNAVAEKRVDFSYDAAGRYDEMIRFDEIDGDAADEVLTADYGFDSLGRLGQLTYEDPADIELVDHLWAFDAASRIITYLNSIDTRTTYSHDDTNQLTGADYYLDWQDDESYTYDANGNRDTVSNDAGSNLAYETGTNNRLIEDGTYRYEYDAEGNRTLRYRDNDSGDTLGTGDTDITQYTWDHRNRLTNVTHYAAYTNYTANPRTPDQIVDFTYDFGNRWVRKVVDTDGNGTANAGTIFIPDDSARTGSMAADAQIVLQFDDPADGTPADAPISHRYLFNPAAVDHLLADEQLSYDVGTDTYTTDNLHWPLTDHLNTVRDIAEVDGNGDTVITDHLIYNAFGKLISQTDGTNTHLHQFTGKPTDEHTGDQWNLNRWYDLVRKHPRYGYRRIWALLRREG